MRVFYTEETDDTPMQYYVNIENINIPDRLKGAKAFEVNSVIDLKNKIIAHYGFKLPDTIELQLWSGPLGTSCIQIGDKDKLPDHKNLWVRAAAASANNKKTI
jgi:hypothetical protein